MFNQLKRDQHLQSKCHCLQQEKEACNMYFTQFCQLCSTGKTLADSASVVGAKHRKLLSGIAPPEKKERSKSVQILFKLFRSAKSISVKNQVSYGQKLVKSIEIKSEMLLSDLLTFVLA